MNDDLFQYLLRLGDDSLILGQRLTEWCGHAPTITVTPGSATAIATGGVVPRGADAVVVDLQDVGARYYTFVWSAVLVARARHARVRGRVAVRRDAAGAAGVVNRVNSRPGRR